MPCCSCCVSYLPSFQRRIERADLLGFKQRIFVAWMRMRRALGAQAGQEEVEEALAPLLGSGQCTRWSYPDLVTEGQ